MVVDKEVDGMMIAEIIIVAPVIGVVVMKMMTAVAIMNIIGEMDDTAITAARIGAMIMIEGGMVTAVEDK